MIVVSLATLTGWALARRAWGDPLRAGLLATAVLFVLFSFERNVHALQVRGWAGTPAGREWLVIGGDVVLLGGWCWLLHGRPGLVRPFTSMANAGSLALLALAAPGFLEAARPASVPGPPHDRRTGAEPKWESSTARPPGQDPDIYFIVLDAYGRSDVLRSLLGYDNSAFLAAMQAKGFYLADRSTSNYCQTALSISATLSGRYHDDLAGSRSRSRLPLRDLVADNPWLGLLRRRGYKLVGCASGFGFSESFPATERVAPAFDVPDFAALLLDMTPIWTLLGQGEGQASHRRHRSRILHVFDHLAAVADDPLPTFALAHIVAPHPPFVFDAEGRDISAETSSFHLTDGKLWSDIAGHGGSDDYARHYRDQATYISRRIATLVDQILARSPRPPVIIIQGDHGPGSRFDSDSPEPNDVVERLSILNLCLIPGLDAAKLRPTMTPVNTFRLIADHHFGMKLGELSDRSYYSSYQAPYQFVDVTEQVGPGRTKR